jgi:16S rRNA (guanine1207-N2)-methyltransferase
VLERRYVLAQALRALKPGGRLIALAPKAKGGARLAQELAAFGCVPVASARRHHRFCEAERPTELQGLDEAIVAGGPQIASALGLWSQPGVFSWDRLDPGTALLLRHLPPLAGAGADFGCGVGLLSLAVLKSTGAQKLALVDADRRAIDAARRNVEDPRAGFAWRDLRSPWPELKDLDFVVMNPPFHEGGHDDPGLGGVFIRRAAEALRKGGTLWMVANRRLPYEAALEDVFAKVKTVEQTDGYKVFEARQ